MGRVTKKAIIKAVVERTGIKAGYVDLIKDGGYAWGGRAGACFSGCETYAKLSDATLERWVEDFEYKTKECLEGSSYGNLNEYIEAIEWSA